MAVLNFIGSALLVVLCLAYVGIAAHLFFIQLPALAHFRSTMDEDAQKRYLITIGIESVIFAVPFATGCILGGLGVI